MPKMKHFQRIADLRNRKKKIITIISDEHNLFRDFYLEELKTNGQTLKDIKVEKDALDYLIGCQTKIALWGKDYVKPEKTSTHFML